MPSKRQPSKQRRAAQNRAQREALAARREHASQPGTPAASTRSTGSSGSSGSSTTKGRRSGFLSGLTGTGGGGAQARPVKPMGGLGGRIMGDTAGQPGARGVLLSVPLALLAAIWLLGFAKLDVDDRGEALPISGSNGFRGLYLATREALTGHEVMPESELGVSAVGAFWLIMVIVPLLVVLGVFFLFRYRRSPSMYWTVTIGMLMIAATVLLLGRIEYVGAMGALTWASFQIRRAELPAKMAERAAVRAEREAAAAAAAGKDDDTYDEDAYDDEAYEEEAYEDEDAYDEDVDEAYEDESYEEDAYDEDVDEDEEPPADGYDGEDVRQAEDVPAAEVPDKRNVDADYDEDILKELEAEIDETERGSGSGGSPPGPR